jgi:hypothetical protein
METSNVYLTPCFGGERKGAVPTMVALQVMEDCVAKGVKFVHLLTAGFTETGLPEHSVKFLRSLLDKDRRDR